MDVQNRTNIGILAVALVRPNRCAIGFGIADGFIRIPQGVKCKWQFLSIVEMLQKYKISSRMSRTTTCDRTSSIKMKMIRITVRIYHNGFDKVIQKIVLLFSFFILSQSLIAQDMSGIRKNTIKLDLTSNIIFRNSYNFTYERVTRPDQTFCVTVGYQQFPKFLSLGSGIETTDDSKKRTGFKIGGEYRFYLKKENKYQAPHGVYIGPYISYLNFHNERDLRITADDGSQIDAFFKSNINILNIGFQAGYQFVINDRFTIDLTFIGPSVSRYGADFQLDGNFDVDEEHEYQNEILVALIDRFPLLDDLIKDKEVDTSGKTSTWGYGYRYQIAFGYRFGHKK
jgi:hypothetical protein